MKRFMFNLLAVCSLFAAITLTSCEDPCADVTCVNGECIEGDCVCDAGYEGAACDTALNAKFAGNYNMTVESCGITGAGNVPYAISISASSTEATGITITGLYEEPNATASAVVDADGKRFTITRASFSTFGVEIDGTGAIDETGNNIQVGYSIYDDVNGAVLDNCTAIIIRL